jgi:RNA polymerase sigma-70 factor (ECF subfamily)
VQGSRGGSQRRLGRGRVREANSPDRRRRSASSVSVLWGRAATFFLMECPSARDVVRVHAAVPSEDERALCERFAGRIHAYGLRHLRDGTSAQDLVQYVLLSVLQALRAGRVEDPTRLDAYVLGTCRNAVMDMRRGDARQRRLALESSAGLPEGYELSLPHVDRARLEDCLRRLEARERAVILATFLEDRDAVEIGHTLNVTAGNVRVIRHRALAHLQGCVEGEAS